MKKSISALLILLFVSVSQVYAEGETGIYLHGFGGVNYLIPPATDRVRLEAKPGYAVGASLGYRVSSTMRLESEFAFRENEFSNFIINVDEKKFHIPAGGNLTKLTYMGNALFNMPGSGILTPYIGGGIGGRRDSGFIDFSAIADDGEEAQLKLRKNGIVYQGIAGLSANCFAKTDLQLEYRILNSGEEHSDHSHTLAVTLQRAF